MSFYGENFIIHWPLTFLWPQMPWVSKVCSFYILLCQKATTRVHKHKRVPIYFFLYWWSCYFLIHLLHLFRNKKFWEEVIAYFPFIWHEPHRKWRLQQFFVTAGTWLPRHGLSTIGDVMRQNWSFRKHGSRFRMWSNKFYILIFRRKEAVHCTTGRVELMNWEA
jgi:hypothetical protein